MEARRGSSGERGHWTADEVAEAMGGRWIVPPDRGWSASGLCIHASTMQPGDLIVLRSDDTNSKGAPPESLLTMTFPPAGIVVSTIPAEGIFDVPVLYVDDMGEAILAMGHRARERMTGKVLAVTGSAGKTTAVAMLAHALSAWGSVGHTSHNANLPHGVAWNLASMPREVAYVVLELAVGRMGQSARMARPHISMFTNIFPAHLGESGSSLRDIALTKSAIFQGMAPGDAAIINRDMLEWETVHSAAKARKLEILHYGVTEESAFRLLKYHADEWRVVADLMGRTHEYRLGAPGKHMALNSLGILAAVSALGLPFEPALAQLETFSPLPGRGEEIEITIEGKHVAVIDDSYNANPGSMAAALDQLSSRSASCRKIAVLGEMADLGPDAPRFHSELSAVVEGLDIDRFYVTGELYSEFWKSLPVARRGRFAPSLGALRAGLLEELANGDVVLFKGSHSTQIHQIVSWMIKQYGTAPFGREPEGSERSRLPEQADQQ